MLVVSKSLVTMGTVFGPKRRRTRSFSRREDGVSLFDMVKELAVDTRIIRIVRRVHKFARNSGGHNVEEKFFKYGSGSIRI